MAIEALWQIKQWHPDQNIKPTFTFRNVNISSALVVQHSDQELELFTTMHEQRISTASISGIWSDFSISSVQSGNSVSHCVGSVSVSLSSVATTGGIAFDATSYDKWTMGRWYEKLAKEGLCFGPAFQTLTSMKTDKARVKPKALSTSKLLQRVPKSANATFLGTFYAMHPLVIDACLQAAIMGGTAGSLEKLKAFLPTFFGHLQISAPDADQLGSEAFIHSQSRTTGFGTRAIDVTMRDQNDDVVINMSDARLSLYTGKVDEAIDPSELNRHPCLRVIWKPDIARLDESRRSELDTYLEHFLSDHPDLTENNSIGVMAGLLDLAGHKNARLRVLEIGRVCGCNARQWLDILGENTDFPRSREWHTGTFAEGELITSPASNSEKLEKVKLDSENIATYDVVLMPQVGPNNCMQQQVKPDILQKNASWSQIADHLPKVLSPQGILIGRKSTEAAKTLKNFGYKIMILVGGVMLAIPPQTLPKFQGRDIVFVGDQLRTSAVVSKTVKVEQSSSPSNLSNEVIAHFRGMVGTESVKTCALEDLDNFELRPKTITVSLLELEKPLLPTMTPEEMNRLRRVTDKATDLIWLTGATYMDGSSPDLTLANGLSRALMLEQPALRFVILDVGAPSQMNLSERMRVCNDIEKALFRDDMPDDKEFVSQNGLLHVSRFVPDDGLNSRFSQRRIQEPCAMTLEEASPARLSIKKIGNMDSIYFQQESEAETMIPEGEVEVDVKAISLNAKVRITSKHENLQ